MGWTGDGLVYDGLETRRWNGTKSAFADYAYASARRVYGRADVLAVNNDAHPILRSFAGG